jgi:Kyakuja-Dileera-Zisupton transposase
MKIQSLARWLYSVLCAHSLESTSLKIGGTTKIGVSIDITTWKLPTVCTSKNLFMRGFMMDGNFQAEHMRMRNPENDVPLSDGAGFMVSKKPYESHLKSALERRQVSGISCFGQHSLTLRQKSSCHDHRAVNNANRHSGHLESTGIGATACIHGAFVPHSVVDFQKGEA